MDYKKSYLYYKKKYLELKQKMNQQHGGNNTPLQPSYLNFGPNDGFVVDSDDELLKNIQNNTDLDKILDLNDSNIKATEDILNIK